MGDTISRGWGMKYHPDEWPDAQKQPTFDPQMGFPAPRKERQMEISWEEMEKAGLDYQERDFCAHILVKFYKCREQHAPLTSYMCGHIKHEYEACEYQDYILRMKEYERERRLMLRAKRIQEREANANTTVVA